MRMGSWHILWREILPNLVPYITLNFILISRNAITASVGIMMLGLVPLKVENWGMMLNLAAFQSGAIFLPQGMTYLLAPLIAIILFQYSLILVNPERHPEARSAEGLRFIDFLLSPEGQQEIARFRVEGQQLFFPNANPAR